MSAPLPLTGYTIVFDIYAGTTLVHEERDTQRGLLELGSVAALLAEKIAAWVQENAVGVEQQFPDVNAGPLPDPQPPPY